MRFAADIEDFLLGFQVRAGDRVIDLVDLILLAAFYDAVAAADNLDSVDIAVPLVRVVVDDAEDLLVDLLRTMNVAKDSLAGLAGADQHDTLGFLPSRAVLGSKEQNETIGKTDSDREDELQRQTEDVIRDRHASEHEPHEEDVDPPGDDRREDHAVKLDIAYESPDRTIKL